MRLAVPQICDNHQPECICYVAGTDPYREDQDFVGIDGCLRDPSTAARALTPNLREWDT